MAALAMPRAALAEEIYDIRWKDLLPADQPVLRNAFRDVIDHDGAPLSSLQPESSGARHEWDGKIVRIPGFVVPLDYAGSGVTTFILVPYAGACIHVPPPPANQLVLVTTEEPYESGGLFEAVSVTGRLGITTVSTELAEVGYSLVADKIELYRS
ncbi:DUF3299 domain-containing protein [Roseivivax lentus]|uniref:DUF3299 domain-containing protein n=1 Tax=Roseivivax lentus TaxID=633194 RepID=UPI001F32B997|nr:DUF3299 domain-containing protein [Roseivivax lentus]